MLIRDETISDYPAVRRLHLDSFLTQAEADLADRLRIDSDAVLSLVAVSKRKIAGHVMLSKMEAPFRALGLAPIAVATELRRQ